MVTPTGETIAGSERRCQLIVESITGYGICLLDLKGFVSSWNAGAAAITGYEAGEVIGQHYSRFFSKEDQDRGEPLELLQHVRTEGRQQIEAWRVRKDGERFWSFSVIEPVRDEAGMLIGFSEIFRDITERLAMQQALDDSERQFRLLVASVTDYALFMLDRNGIVSSWNAGAEKIKGYRPDEIIGQHFSRFYTEQDRAAGKPARSLSTATREGRFEAEGWRVRKDGSIFWANVVIDAIHDDTGRLVGFAKITRDVTERRQAQLALQRAHEQLAQAQKMEALGQLTGGIAHDFNNLLTIVGGQAQILKRQLADRPRALRAAEAIEAASQRGASLTRRLLAFSRRQYLRPESLDLNTLADALRTMLPSSLNANIQLVVDLGEQVWPVLADPGELELALVNLVVNARDAMPQGGTLRISAENATLQPGDRQVELKGDFVALTVADTGTGIPEDVLPKVFDPFFTTKPVDKGTGLGLSQVYGFVHQSGGSLSLDSTIGEGTRITLFLPRATQAPSAAGAGGAEPDTGRKRILVVEDNPDVASVTVGMLEELGHRSVLVHSAEAALQAMEGKAVFDLVFTDIVMAGMDGLQLAAALQQRYPHVPVLLTSGYTRLAENAQLHWPVLRKPFKLGELNRALAQVMIPRAAA